MIKRLLPTMLILVLVLSLGACKCPAAKNSVTQIQGTHKIVAALLMDYVQKDATLSADEKARRKALVDEDQANIDKLEKALGD
jgi:Tfp pilus assembly protein PilF